MPNGSLPNTNINMKNLKLILLLVLSPLTFLGQSLSGLWMGTLTNDSTSVRQDQSFEIVLTQYKEKVYGYSRSTFIVNDTLYYIVKRVKGTIAGDVCEVKDDYVVSHNFPKKPEKGVRVISTFKRNLQDSSWYLAGDWKTTQTKKYYTVSGKVDLREEKDLASSKLFPHLQELGLSKDVPMFVAATRIEDPTEVKTTSKIQTLDGPTKGDISNTNTKGLRPANSEAIKPAIVKTVVTKEPVTDIAKNTITSKAPIESSTNNQKSIDPPVTKNINSPVTSPNNNSTQKTGSIAQVNSPVQSNPIPKTTSAKNTDQVSPKQTPVNQPQVIANNQAGQIKSNPIAKTENNPQPKSQVSSETISPAPKSTVEEKKPDVKSTVSVSKPAEEKSEEAITEAKQVIKPTDRAAELLTIRKTEAPQIVNYVSDSLVLILYDNGEVDGDTVSVLLNGEMFMEKQGLKTAAIKKTVYITPGNEEMTLVLFAENLGKYPPNTGLLVVYDGEERHQLRFSADFQKNASVVFRRKK